MNFLEPQLFRKKLIEHATPQEKIVQTILNRNKISHKFQKAFQYREGHHYFADFFFHQKSLILEIDGNHHLYSQARKDLIREGFLKTYKHINITRIPNKMVKDDYEFENYLLSLIDCYSKEFDTNRFVNWFNDNIGIEEFIKANGKIYKKLLIRNQYEKIRICKQHLTIILSNLPFIKKFVRGEI